MKTTYTIEYHKPSKKWVVWKNVESEKGYSFKGMFSGNRKECLKWIKTNLKKD